MTQPNIESDNISDSVQFLNEGSKIRKKSNERKES